jgi:ribonuclease HII
MQKPALKYENSLKRKGFKSIAGVDEVGRGPLAGPVVVSAVILPKDFKVPGINDSKKIKEEQREFLYQKLIEQVCFGIGLVDETKIDKINILQATFLAMNKAVGKLKVKPEHILFDGNRYNHSLNIPQTLIIKGDSISKSIAAASIIAKVYRDNLMKKYHLKYPQYCFDKNKGYGTKVHMAAIEKYGPCPIHRRSFIKNIQY